MERMGRADMSDYISREAAIKSFCDGCIDEEDCHASPHKYVCAEVETIKAIPAADVREVKKGKWYWDKDGMDWGIGSWRCSECHSRPETWWQCERSTPYNKSGHYFCPNCGADMRGETE